jgi:hypothetical protein
MSSESPSIKKEPFVATPATKAYLIRGHGSEGDTKFKVPNHCIIVVKVKAGAYSYEHSELTNKLCELSPTILKDPDQHHAEIYNAFGNVAIYTPGQMCPNFILYPLSCFPAKKPFDSCLSFGSGIIDIDPFLHDSRKRCNPVDHRMEKLRFKAVEKGKLKDIYKYIGDLYEHSAYPLSEDVLNYIDDLTDKDITSFQDILNEINDHFRTTQKELCKSNPGVYYNFVCRNNPVTNKLFTRKNNNTPHVLRNSIESVLSIISKEEAKEKEELHKEQKKLNEILAAFEKAQNEYMTNEAAFEKRKAHLANELQAMELKQKERNTNALYRKYESQRIAVEEAKKMLRSKRIAQTLKNHIGEAEMQRKPAMRHIYTPSYIKKRRQNEYRDLERQLIENQQSLEEHKRQIESLQGLCSASNGAACKRKDELIATYQGAIDAIENRLRNAKRTHSLLKKQMRSVSGGYTRKRVSTRS